MNGYAHESAKYVFEKLYIRAFIIDSIIAKTEDFFNEKNIDHEYNPREDDPGRFIFRVGDMTYRWWFTDLWTRNSMLEISVDEDYDAAKSKKVEVFVDRKPKNVLKYQISVEDYSKSSAYYDGDLMEEYCGILDTVVNEVKEIKEVFLMRTNEGLPMAATYVADDFLYKFEMEISWMRSKKYVSDRISLNDLMKLDIDDINYNNIVYRFEDRGSIDKLYKHATDIWKLGKLHRIEHVKLNGLFYVENCDLQDISELGYDTLTSIIDSKYKIVEVYEENGYNAQGN